MFHAAVPVKLAWIAVGVLGAADIGWMVAIFAQLDGGSANASTIIPAAALTGTSGALVWVVKQIVGGKLVHVDPAKAQADLKSALDRSSVALAAAADRERALHDILLGQQRGRRGSDE